MSVLETARLRLRLLEAGDTADEGLFRDLYTDPEVVRRIAAPLSEQAVQRSFHGACRYNQSERPGHRYWRIDDRATDAGIGLAALTRSGERNERAEIGVMLFRPWWNRGICSETFVPVLEFGFERLGLEWVDARSAEDDALPVIERLLAPFGFDRVRAGAEDGIGHWVLSRERWSSPAPGHPRTPCPA